MPEPAPIDFTPARVALGIFGGFALLAIVDAAAIAFGVPLPAGGIALRFAHHAFDAAQTLGLGAVFALFVAGLLRLVRRAPPWGLACIGFAVGVALAWSMWGEYLLLSAPRVFGARYQAGMLIFWLALLGAAFAGAPFAAPRVSHLPVVRHLPLAVAVIALIVNQIVLRDDYFDAHCVVGLGAALLGGGAVAPPLRVASRSLAKTLPGRAALAALGLFAIFGIAVPPGNAVRFELFRQPCAMASWALATFWRTPQPHGPVQLPPSRWLSDRSSDPPVPPTTPPLLPHDAVVVLITIDAVRAELLRDPRTLDRLPTLGRLRRESVDFTRAYAPGAQTEVSLASLFSSLYYSEQRWATYGEGWIRLAHPAEDASPRFPELLSEHGIATAHVAGIPFLAERFGIARGFREVTMLGRDRSYATGARIIAAVLDRLQRAGPGPLFLYAHLLDAHAPYVAGRRSDPDYERYVQSIAIDDELLGRVLSLLEESFGRRWVLFVSSDHGEAFGEHQSRDHAKTLYEELLRVPLLVRSPLLAARSIDARVGLVDLGPTLLDLFGVGSPATFEGQSLVPLLQGGATPLTRPLIAEGRLRRALTEPDGLKIIDDPRRKVVEVYDLVRDPGETRNLFDAEPARADLGLTRLRAFFEAHALRAGGYVPPYKR